MFWLICLFLSLFVLTVGLTRLLISNARLIGLMDLPNERSLHRLPLPRGGGIGFVLSFLTGALILWLFDMIPTHLIIPLITGGPIVALMGFLDDWRSIPPIYRLLAHLFAAVLTCFWLTDGFKTSIDISFLFEMPAWLQISYSVLFITWMINLYNFMDGADGLAATQAIVVALFSTGLCLWQNNISLALLYGLIACSVSGFLLFNWAPARIFMGDGGAYFLGFLFAALALMNKMFFNQSLIALMIIMGIFIVDATYTLSLRLLQGERVYLPHKKHAFQKVAQNGWSHAQISLIYNLITTFWLAPWAILAVIYANYSVLFLLISYAPLLVAMIYLRAGTDKQPTLRKS